MAEELLDTEAAVSRSREAMAGERPEALADKVLRAILIDQILVMKSPAAESVTRLWSRSSW